MKRKVFIAITAAMISASTSVSSAQVKTPLPSSQPSKSVPALSEEQIKSLIQAETEKKDALRGQAEAERKFNFTMTWVQVLLAGVSTLAIIPVLLGLFFLIFRKSIFGQLNAEATKEVAKQVEEYIKPIIDTEIQSQISALIEKKLNPLVQEFKASVPDSTQEIPSPEKLSKIEELRRRIEDLQDLIPTVIQSAEYYFKQGNAFYFEGKYEESIAAYDKALVLHPENPDILITRAISLVNLGRYEEATISLDKAIGFKPDDPDTWNLRGVAISNLSHYEEAIASFDKSLGLRPDDPDTWNLRGIALSHLNHYEEALISYNKALEFRPDDPDTWTFRGIALSHLNHYEEALVSYNKAIEIKPNHDSAWYNRACYYAHQEKVEEAVHDLKKAIELDSTWREKTKIDSDFDKVRQDERFQKLLKDEP
jgi:tetratricopeptide (TPR) repeat protein